MENWFKPRKRKAKLHSKIKFLFDFQYTRELELLREWIQDFTSPDGELKSIDEFQATFHSVFFELYLNQLFLRSGAKIDSSQTAPDFKVSTNDLTYFVEATVANIAKESRQEIDRTEKDVYGKNNHYEIIDESIRRLRRRMEKKIPDYFKSYGETVKSFPFVLALADYSQVSYGQAGYFAPLAVLYNAYYDPDDKTDLKFFCEDSFDRVYKFKAKSGADGLTGSDLGFFSSAKYSHISAVIYTSMLSLGKLSSLLPEHGILDKYICLEREDRRTLRFSKSTPDESLGDGVFVFHNPFAQKPLDNEFLSLPGITHVRFKEDDNLIEVSCPDTSPLIRRFVGPAILASTNVPDFDEFNFIEVPQGHALR